MQDEQKGIINPNKLDFLKKWRNTYRLQDLLQAVSKEIEKPANKGRAQPPEGQEFPVPRGPW